MQHTIVALGFCKGVVSHLMLKEGSSESKTLKRSGALFSHTKLDHVLDIASLNGKLILSGCGEELVFHGCIEQSRWFKHGLFISVCVIDWCAGRRRFPFLAFWDSHSTSFVHLLALVLS